VNAEPAICANSFGIACDRSSNKLARLVWFGLKPSSAQVWLT